MRVNHSPRLSDLCMAGPPRLTLAGNPEKPNVQHSTQLKGHTAAVEKVAFNPVRDAELCSVGADGVIKFWDVRTKACVNEVRDLGDTFTLAWAPDGDSLVVGNRVSGEGVREAKRRRLLADTIRKTTCTYCRRHSQPRWSRSDNQPGPTTWHSVGAARNCLPRLATAVRGYCRSQT